MSSALDKVMVEKVENLEDNQTASHHDPTGVAGIDESDDVFIERKIRNKVDLHLIPVLFILLLLAFLDRVNIGNARIQGLEKDLGMLGTNKYNIALLVFFITYIIFEIPSNFILKHARPSIYLPGLIFCWGVITICQGLTQSYGGLVVCRLMIGLFEAGFFPGAVYLISMYYKRHELQKRVTIFFSGGIIAGAFSGLLAYAIANMDGIAGYHAWRWIFIIEGIATCVIAALSYFFLPDWPESARFLTVTERQFLIRRLERDSAEAAMSRYTRDAAKRTFSDVKIWLSVFMFIGVANNGYSVSFFIPTILTELGWTSVRAQVMTIPIYLTAFVCTLCAAIFSDIVKHRYSFVMFGCMVSIIGYGILLNAQSISVNIRYMAIYFVATGGFIAQPIVVGWLSNNMAGHYKRGMGSAIQIGFGNTAGLIASNIYITTEAPFYRTGYSVGLSLILTSALCGTIFVIILYVENKKRDQGKRDYLLELPAEQLNNLGDDHPYFRFTY